MNEGSKVGNLVEELLWVWVWEVGTIKMDHKLVEEGPDE